MPKEKKKQEDHISFVSTEETQIPEAKPPEIDESEKKHRGRPKGSGNKPKPKTYPKFDPKNYRDHFAVQLINRVYYGTVEKVSGKTLTPEDKENIAFGESVLYVLEYYLPSMPFNHPILAPIESVVTTFLAISQKEPTPKPTKKQEQLEKAMPDVQHE